MDKELLMTDEVANWLRVDKQRVYELVRTNRIPFIKLGDRQYRFSATAIQRWLDEGGSQNAGELFKTEDIPQSSKNDEHQTSLFPE